MRLTLRTLLAYMDDILEPADHEDLGKKIEASDFATELIHRSRDTVRRLRLGAPAVLADDSGDVLDSVDLGDANSVAEYLDNTLPPEQVADFERMCLEPGMQPDMHLAEVASCHHILTMVLGEPAEVEADLKSRVYQLPSNLANGQRLRIEPAHVAPVAAPPEQPVAPPQAPSPVQTAGDVDPELPDYLREAVASRRRSRRWAIATTLVTAAGAIFYWFAITPPAELPPDVADANIESLDDGEINIEGFGDTSAGTIEGSGGTDSAAPPFMPESSAAAQAPAFIPDSPDALEAAPSFSPAVPAAEPIDTEPVDSEQPPEVEPVLDSPDGSIPAIDEPTVEMATENVVPAEPAPIASASSGEETPEAELDGPFGVSEPALMADSPESAIDEDTPLAADFPATDTPAPIDPEEESNPEPVGPHQLGNYLGNNDVLLIRDVARDKWIRMPPRSPISTGDELLTLPKFRKAHVVLADVNAYLTGATRVRIPLGHFDASAMDAELDLEIVFGRLLLNAGLKGSRVAIEAGEQLREFSMASSASLAIEVDRVFVPGSDYENEAAPIKATWYLTSGSIEWPTAAGGTQMVQAPAMWRTVDGIDEIPELLEELPAWIDREPVTDVERIARGDLAKELVVGDPVSIRLLELTDGKGVGRKKEVRILAAASSVFVGEFEPLVKALNDSDQKRAWETHINDLRQALALSPDVAKRVRQAFVNIRGEEAAADLMQMVIGYSSEQIGESRESVQQGALATLLKWLDHDSLDYRVLAIHNLREITGGVTKGYRADDTSKNRKKDLRKIWEQFEANELLPQP